MSRPFELQQLLRSWTPPRELRLSRSREVQLSGGGKALAALGFLLAAGAVAALVGLQTLVRAEMREIELLRAHGIETTGQVVRIIRDQEKKSSYRLVYGFQVGEAAYDRRVQVTAATARGLPVGSSLAVRYLPSDPAINYPSGWRQKTMPAWLPPLAGLGLLALSWLPAHALRSQRRLLAEGRPAPAVVTRHHKDQHGVTIHYEFPLLSGARCAGKSGPMKKPPEIGSQICIIYDPDQPSRNSKYPFSLVEPRTF